MAQAYSAGAADWATGPALVYERLAERLVAFSPVPFAGSTVLDLGSGTGLGSRAALAAGGRVVATDVALGMLRQDFAQRPPATVGDALALPFRDGAFDIVLAAFSLNHLEHPELGVAEAARVGEVLLASTYAADDDHPVKGAVEAALGELGWTRPGWYDVVKQSMSAWGTVDQATKVIVQGGMRPVRVERLEVLFPELLPPDMVAWRMGLAQSGPFVAALPPELRARAVRRALELLGPGPGPLVRRVIFLAAAQGGERSGDVPLQRLGVVARPGH
ncbi:MAG TPA: class I SAM-dependent methyltransferase [Acidimicrobiales bacterium]|nr:class I SAM-dependent methyltransferase [Acidimicrobiales bacterium]